MASPAGSTFSAVSSLFLTAGALKSPEAVVGIPHGSFGGEFPCRARIPNSRVWKVTNDPRE